MENEKDDGLIEKRGERPEDIGFGYMAIYRSARKWVQDDSDFV